MTVHLSSPTSVDAETAEAVRDLAARSAEVDGVAALSEASRLALVPHPPAGTRHLLAHDGGRLVGYAQVWPDDSAELVVAPDARRRGTGTDLWHSATAAGAARVWSHGDLESARGFAAAAGLTGVRTLLRMGRGLGAADLSPRPLPPGFAVTTFAERAASVEDPVGELRALNAAAFADHPEQGRLTDADLRARMAEPWFEARGLLLVLPEADGEQPGGTEPVAFHWTKVEPDQDPTTLVGEVYVVGVSPAYQGRGLAGPLTDLGLAHLARRGCTAVVLYVDGENAPARATYERAGLTVQATDRVYASAAAADAVG